MSNEDILKAVIDEAAAEGRDLGAEAQAVIEEIEKEERIDRSRALTTKERLKRRLVRGYIDIPFDDDLGSFNVKMRLPSPSQRRQFIQLTVESEKALTENDEETLRRLDAEMMDMIGDLCMDFDADYIKSGENFGIDVIFKLMSVIVGAEPVNMDEYKFFRSPS